MKLFTAEVQGGAEALADDPDGRIQPGMHLIGRGNTRAWYPVTDFSQMAVATAVNEVLSLIANVWSEQRSAWVDRALSSHWCIRSAHPLDWTLPPGWDEYAGDYRTRDGWIRLHTNAPHHRAAALHVLGPDPRSRVSGWCAEELETAVVAAGGAAARMLSTDQWRQHPQGRAVNGEPVVAWSCTAAASAGDHPLAQAVPARPLRGLRVLDLTRVLAGPVSTRFLASLGADVLRIDPPFWDEDINVPEMTIGKHCAGLDLRNHGDRQQFDRLLSRAHVIVHGYRKDALPGLNYDDEARSRLNPSLIDVALNAYGWTGPWAGRRGFDSLVQMSSGIAAHGMRCEAADRPVPLPFQALDHASGYLMAAVVIQAINRHVTQGRRCSARLSLARQATLLQDMMAAEGREENGCSRGSCEDKPARLSSGEIRSDAWQADDMALRDDYFSARLEDSPWGKLRRLRLPYRIEGVDLSFDRPVTRLRSQPARWSDL